MPDFWLSGARSVEPSIKPGDRTPSIYLRTSTDDGWLFVGDEDAAAQLVGAANAILSHYQQQRREAENAA